MRKWQPTACINNTTVTELWGDDKGILVERDYDKCRYFISNVTLAKMYVEHKEPRKIEGWINIYQRPSGPRFGEVSWPSRDEAIKCGGSRSDYLDTIKITWTEGQ